MTRYLTIIHDIDGLPRAYGAADTMTVSILEAERQWGLRLERAAREGTFDRGDERGETKTMPVKEEPTITTHGGTYETNARGHIEVVAGPKEARPASRTHGPKKERTP